jgi:(2Fe-2S) ferredoxin
MPRRELYVFVCTNRRAPENPKGSCANGGSEAVLDRLKGLVFDRGLKDRVRVMASGCQDLCGHGPIVSVWPAGTFYGRVRVEDCETIVAEHFENGRTVESLVLPHEAFED